MIDLKRNLFKIDVRAQKDEEKVFMRTAWYTFSQILTKGYNFAIMK
ncbi:hupothetical protein [Streptococcus pyogenes]|nr:hupothetical protein [Streptococcus pyogenes]VGY22395.1 hupothetical protein [Streptococcus pyogenes]VGY52695.1 hupothetical protein [Streptococcus pyogenes]VHK56477.1 hupothetical protein [Streptococcus pyogenes]VHK90434.1 hupothetical protein [Streptococcus pyogenes]